MAKTKNKSGKNTKSASKKVSQQEAISLLESLEKKKETVKMSVEPEFRATQTISMISGEVLNIGCLYDVLKENAGNASKGDMRLIENMLITQAQTLDAVFNNMVMLSFNAQYLKPMEYKMRLALKAQNQCRATLQTLANIKNPSHTSFVKQQNVAYQQQVNNGITASGIVAKSNDNQPKTFQKNLNSFSRNELLEVNNNVTRLEPRTAGKASEANSELETLE